MAKLTGGRFAAPLNSTTTVDEDEDGSSLIQCISIIRLSSYCHAIALVLVRFRWLHGWGKRRRDDPSSRARQCPVTTHRGWFWNADSCCPNVLLLTLPPPLADYTPCTAFGQSRIADVVVPTECKKQFAGIIHFIRLLFIATESTVWNCECVSWPGPFTHDISNTLLLMIYDLFAPHWMDPNLRRAVNSFAELCWPVVADMYNDTRWGWGERAG